MKDEEIVQSALDRLAAQRAKREKDECDFFQVATADIQEAYYQYWIRAYKTHDKQMPMFLAEYESKRSKTSSF